MKINKIIKIGVILTVLIIPFASWGGRRVRYNNLAFELNDLKKTATFIGVATSPETPWKVGDCIIPEYIEDEGETYIVDNIYQNAFNNKSVGKISIPPSISYIGNDAFRNAHFQDLDFRKDKDGNYGIKVIENKAFTKATCTGTVFVPNSVKKVGFDNCSFHEIVFDNDFNLEIYYDTFVACKFDSMVIGDNMNFIYSRIEDDNVHRPDNPYFRSLNVKHISTYIDMCSQNRIDSSYSAFSGVQGLESLEYRGLNNESIDFYPVTFTGKGRYDNKTLKSLTLPEGFTICDCENLPYSIEELNLPDSMEEINNLSGWYLRYFIWSPNLKKCSCFKYGERLFMKPTTPPESPYSFSIPDLTIFRDTKLYVPYGSLDVYKNHEGWGKFWYIEEYDPNNFSAVSEIQSEINGDDIVRYYSLDGRILPDYPSQPGIYVRVKDGKAAKFVVK